jgi:hypothetical protein
MSMMLCNIDFTVLSLILVPSLSVVLLALVVIVLLPKNRRDKSGLLVKEFLNARNAIASESLDRQTVRRLNTALRKASELCRNFSQEDFYELGNVFERTYECHRIVRSLILTGEENTLKNYQQRLFSLLRENLKDMQAMNLIPNYFNIDSMEIPHGSSFFSKKRKEVEAKRFLDTIFEKNCDENSDENSESEDSIK